MVSPARTRLKLHQVDALTAPVLAQEGQRGQGGQAHRTSEAMAAATSALAELIAEAELMTGEPVSAKGVPA